jgi:S-(hydroxymethyl)glutathione dehydrogenase/alcohol dehydrogenase
MRAAVLWEPGAAFEVRDDIERRGPGPGEVVVQVRASGVCRTDLSLADGTFDHPMPVVLGHEGAGVVTETGPGVEGISAGQHAVIDWVGPDGTCWYCLRGLHHLCARRASSRAPAEPTLHLGGEPVISGLGTATFAEETLLPATAVVPIEDDVPFPIAAILGCAVATGVGAVFNSARLAPGDTALVIGCGGVGMAVLLGAVAAGASEIVAVDPVPARRESARQFGARRVAASVGEAQEIGATLPAGGFDHAFDVVGAPATIRGAWDAVRPAGQAVIVGAGRRDAEVSFNPYELFHHEKRLFGSFYGSVYLRRDAPRFLALWRAGRLDLDALVTATVPLTEVNAAVASVQAGEGIRTVLIP